MTKFITRKELVFELGALALLVISTGILAMPFIPFFDDMFMKKTPEEVIIRLYVQEYKGIEPDEIVLKKDVKVNLIMISEDMTHSLVVQELGIDTGPIHPGQKKVIEITPTVTGEFVMRCMVNCSPQHSNMVGKIIVR